MDPVNIPAKFEVYNFIRSCDNRGYSKTLGIPCIRPRSIFSQIFNWLLFAIYLPNLTFVTLPISEIIGGTQKTGAVPVYAHAPFSPKFFNRLLFAWTIWIYLPNLTFVALPIPEIIGGTSKSWGVPEFAHAPYSPKFLKGFCSHWPCEYTRQVWSS